MCVLCQDVEGKGGSPAPSKQPRYQLGKEQRGTIKVDTSNKKMWDHLLTTIRTVSHLSFYLLTLLFLWLSLGWVPVSSARFLLLYCMSGASLPTHHNLVRSQYLQGESQCTYYSWGLNFLNMLRFAYGFLGFIVVSTLFP